MGICLDDFSQQHMARENLSHRAQYNVKTDSDFKEDRRQTLSMRLQEKHRQRISLKSSSGFTSFSQ
jgi:hypothetical protein